MAQDAPQNSPEPDVHGRIGDSSRSAWNEAFHKGRDALKATTQRTAQIGEQCRSSRAGEIAESIRKHAEQGLDSISGKAMYELVRERLELQDRYNDLLATKLQEALDRIERLEARLDEAEASGEPSK